VLACIGVVDVDSDALAAGANAGRTAGLNRRSDWTRCLTCAFACSPNGI
jgi:hypothetical protein